MIRKPSECVEEIRKNMRGGDGEVVMLNLLTPDEFLGKGRVFAKMTIKPGCSVGYHVHDGESEIYYVIKGTGLYNDGGDETTVTEGDVLVTPVGGGHAVGNNSENDLEIIALILFE